MFNTNGTTVNMILDGEIADVDMTGIRLLLELRPFFSNKMELILSWCTIVSVTG